MPRVGFEVRIDHYWHHAQLADVLDKLDQILALLRAQGATMAADLDTLKASVQQTTDLEQSAITLITGLAEALRAAQAANDPAALQSIIDTMDTQAAALAQAISANTPAA
jgi:hypothetical protein